MHGPIAGRRNVYCWKKRCNRYRNCSCGRSTCGRDGLTMHRAAWTLTMTGMCKLHMLFARQMSMSQCSHIVGKYGSRLMNFYGRSPCGREIIGYVFHGSLFLYTWLGSNVLCYILKKKKYGKWNIGKLENIWRSEDIWKDCVPVKPTIRRKWKQNKFCKVKIIMKHWKVKNILQSEDIWKYCVPVKLTIGRNIREVEDQSLYHDHCINPTSKFYKKHGDNKL